LFLALLLNAFGQTVKEKETKEYRRLKAAKERIYSKFRRLFAFGKVEAQKGPVDSSEQLNHKQTWASLEDDDVSIPDFTGTKYSNSNSKHFIVQIKLHFLMENFILQHNGGTRNEIKSFTKNRIATVLRILEQHGTLVNGRRLCIMTP
jgi:hypothetical protein